MPKKYADGNRGARRRQDHARVDPAGKRAGHRGVLQSSGEELRQELGAPHRDDQSARRTKARQRQSLGQMLSKEIESASAEREADGRLALPARLAYEQQAGHIRNRDE